MPVKIRLMRIGTKKRPFYRVVAVDEQRKRTGGYIELLGTYNPLTEPKEIKLKQDRIDEWIKNGAQMSDGFLRIIGKAPQKPPRKPKKAKPEDQKKP
ncbi:MAG: 30S ribosomal protein S16 [Candidatus Daviesbacteria bacterium GW2011_GWA2_38_24]|uniref:Small ribosomal subunit protein bS16 n=1 Tax=Candidatus Daviesbacteria bacterium GW2011_GWA2_38_24 TaxID=1618422 RepID=A0A0G0MND6_9BACT|nr:MAG: 30S ribosomal protein S16 [Candidatus Daviesbacteria bacterium GW2011_GWA2_38_24]OGE22582.1 MAG: 30S ribosomal protein S16 [Candidatus Daviesbacteria bacterium RIFCSPHIGHO2_01_FULL_38_8]